MQEECEKDLQILLDQNKKLMEKLAFEEKNEYFQEKIEENASLEAVLKEKLENIQIESEKIEKDREDFLNKLFLNNNQELDSIRDFKEKSMFSTIDKEVQTLDFPKEKENTKENIEKSTFSEEIKRIYNKIARFLKKKASETQEIPLNSQIKAIFSFFKAKNEQIEAFEDEKSRFIEDFTKETQELTENWRLFDKKKLEYKQKLNEEKELLYKELDEEYRKFNNKTRNLSKSPMKIKEIFEKKPENIENIEKEQRKLEEIIEEKTRNIEILEQSMKQ